MAKNNFQQIAITALAIIIVAWFLVEHGAIISISAVVGSGVITVLPGLLITSLGIIVAAEAKDSPGVVGCFAIMGVGLAILFGEMYDAGIIVDAMLGGATIIQFETLSVVFFTLVGGVVYATRRG